MIRINFKERSYYTKEQKEIIQSYNEWMDFILSTDDNGFRKRYLNVWDKIKQFNRNLPDDWYRAQQELRNNIPNQDSVWRDGLCPCIKAKADDYRDTLVKNSAFSGCDYDEMDKYTKSCAERAMWEKSYSADRGYTYGDITSNTDEFLDRIFKALGLMRFDTDFITVSAGINLFLKEQPDLCTENNSPVYFAILYASGRKQPSFHLIVPRTKLCYYNEYLNLHVTSIETFFNDLVRMDYFETIKPSDEQIFEWDTCMVQNTKKFLLDKTERLVTRVAFLARITKTEPWCESQGDYPSGIPTVYTMDEIEVRSGLYNSVSLSLSYNGVTYPTSDPEITIIPSVGTMLNYSNLLLSPHPFPEISPMVDDKSKMEFIFAEPKDKMISTIVMRDRDMKTTYSGNLNRNLKLDELFDRPITVDDYDFVSFASTIASDAILSINMKPSYGKPLSTVGYSDIGTKTKELSDPVVNPSFTLPFTDTICTTLEKYNGIAEFGDFDSCISIEPVRIDTNLSSYQYSEILAEPIGFNETGITVWLRRSAGPIGPKRINQYFFKVTVDDGYILNKDDLTSSKSQVGYFGVEVNTQATTVMRVFVTPLASSIEIAKVGLNNKIYSPFPGQSENIEILDMINRDQYNSPMVYDEKTDTTDLTVKLKSSDIVDYDKLVVQPSKFSASWVTVEGNTYKQSPIDINYATCSMVLGSNDSLVFTFKHAMRRDGAYLVFDFAPGCLYVKSEDGQVTYRNAYTDLYYSCDLQSFVPHDMVERHLKVIAFKDAINVPKYYVILSQTPSPNNPDDVKFNFTMGFNSTFGYRFKASDSTKPDSIRIRVGNTSLRWKCNIIKLSNSYTDEKEVGTYIQAIESEFTLPRSMFEEEKIIKIDLSELMIEDASGNLFTLYQTDTFDFTYEEEEKEDGTE